MVRPRWHEFLVCVSHLGGTQHFFKEPLNAVIEAIFVAGTVIFEKLQSQESAQRSRIGKIGGDFRGNPVIPVVEEFPKNIPEIGIENSEKALLEDRRLSNLDSNYNNAPVSIALRTSSPQGYHRRLLRNE